MIDSYLRAHYQMIAVNPILRMLTSVRPSVITFGALLLGLSVPILLFLEAPFAACMMLILSGYLDTLDGSLARANGTATDQGTVFDIVSDRAVEFAVVLGLFLVAPENRGLLSLLMLGSILICVTSFLVVGIFTQNDGEKGFHYHPGIIERTEAFAFFAAMILCPSYFIVLGGVFTTLVLFTAAVRVFQFSRGLQVSCREMAQDFGSQ